MSRQCAVSIQIQPEIPSMTEHTLLSTQQTSLSQHLQLYNDNPVSKAVGFFPSTPVEDIVSSVVIISVVIHHSIIDGC